MKKRVVEPIEHHYLYGQANVIFFFHQGASPHILLALFNSMSFVVLQFVWVCVCAVIHRLFQSIYHLWLYKRKFQNRRLIISFT